MPEPVLPQIKRLERQLAEAQQKLIDAEELHLPIERVVEAAVDTVKAHKATGHHPEFVASVFCPLCNAVAALGPEWKTDV